MVTVRYGMQSWSISKDTLCAQSVFFQKALTGQFEEAATRVVDLKDVEPEAVAWVMTHLTTGRECFSPLSSFFIFVIAGDSWRCLMAACVSDNNFTCNRSKPANPSLLQVSTSSRLIPRL